MSQVTSQSTCFRLRLGLGLGLGLAFLGLELGLGLRVFFSQVKHFDSSTH